MINNKKLLAIVPARGGSKRLPNKNILKLGGRPMIEWTLDAASKSKYLDHIIVSTDSVEIAKVCRNKGVDVPFLRPEKLSTDDASSIGVVCHGVEFLEKQGRNYDYVVLLQPTSPLRTSVYIDEALEYLELMDADAVISVCEVDHNPLLSNILPKDKSMSSFLNKGAKSKRSQDLPNYHRLNGAIYICKIDRLLKEKSFFLTDNIYAYEMPRAASVDVDTQLDFDFCYFLMNK